MTLYQQLLFPALQRFDPETAHELTLRALAFAQRRRLGRAILRMIAGQIPERSIELFGLRFANELGVAAGFDKDSRAVVGLGELGFGHVEVGTLTPEFQAGNPKPRVFRLPEDKALINRMGFPNQGAAKAAARLASARRAGIIVGASLGKQKETSLANAADDYLTVMSQVFPCCDYLAVNVSSPNTPGLRDLQGRQYLEHLIDALLESSKNLALQFQVPERPLLLKIAPDLSWSQLDDILDVVLDRGVNGIIATNTTVSRNGVTSSLSCESGGLSGLPLADRSSAIIAHIYRQTDGSLPIIGVGGVFTADDVKSKLDAGASLVQLYTGIVYQGPRVAGRILRRL